MSNIEIADNNGTKIIPAINVVEEKEAKADIRTTMNIISKALVGTLGPYGSTSIIQMQEKMQHYASKDGYDVLSRLMFSDELPRTILDLVQTISQNQVLSVGDGSTSTVVVANALHNILTDANNKETLFKRIAAKDITDMLNTLATYIEEEIRSLARPIPEDDLSELETVAMIATNNDTSSGKLIREIYEKIGRYGFISTEVKSRVDVDTYDIKEGVEWNFGYIDSHFAKGIPDNKIVYDSDVSGPISIFISNSELDYDDQELLLSELLGDECNSKKRKLLIIANNYDPDVRQFFNINRWKHTQYGQKSNEVDFTAVGIDQTTELSIETLKDLATLVGVEIYDKSIHNPIDYNLKRSKFVGTIKKAVITSKSTQIIVNPLENEDAIERKNKRIEYLEGVLNEFNNKVNTDALDEMSMHTYKKSLANLKSSLAVLNVAGKTLTERQTRERLYEDAIFASRSALKYGVAVGGNTIIPRFINKHNDVLVNLLLEKFWYIPVEDKTAFFKTFLDLVKESFLESYRNVLHNSYFTIEEVEDVIKKCIDEDLFYNLKLHKYDSIADTSVINSIDTDIQIMRNCFSLIGILAMSNQVITRNTNLNSIMRSLK